MSSSEGSFSMFFPLDMSVSGTLGFWPTDVVKTTLLYVVSSSAVVKPYQRKKKDQRPGRITCSESAGLISIRVPFAKKARWLWLSFCFLPGAMTLRIYAHECHRQNKYHDPFTLRKQHPVFVYSAFV
jgi:hypothetical protein